MRTVTCRPYPHPPAVVRLVLDRGLYWLPAQTLVGIDEVLPEDGRRKRHLVAHIQIGVSRTDVLAAALAHLLENGIQVVDAPACLAKGVVCLAVLRQLE